MKNGKLDEGEACLRIKVSSEAEPRSVIADPVAYTIEFIPHPRSGDEWCIYPTIPFYNQCLSNKAISSTYQKLQDIKVKPEIKEVSLVITEAQNNATNMKEIEKDNEIKCTSQS